MSTAVCRHVNGNLTLMVVSFVLTLLRLSLATHSSSALAYSKHQPRPQRHRHQQHAATFVHPASAGSASLSLGHYRERHHSRATNSGSGRAMVRTSSRETKKRSRSFAAVTRTSATINHSPAGSMPQRPATGTIAADPIRREHSDDRITDSNGSSKHDGNGDGERPNSRSSSSSTSDVDADGKSNRRYRGGRSLDDDQATAMLAQAETLVGKMSRMVQDRRPHEAIALFDQARKAAARARAVAGGAWGDAREGKGVVPRFAYDHALRAYAAVGDARTSLALIRQMRATGGALSPTVQNYNSCLQACARNKRYQELTEIFGRMRKDKVSPDERSYGVALKACAKGSSVEDAVNVVRHMWTSVEEKKDGASAIPPRTFHYNCAIEAAARSGDWRAAIDILREMEERDVRPDAFSYGGALGACGRGGQWEQALGLIKEMGDKYTGVSESHGDHHHDELLLPKAVHCNGLLVAFCKGGRLDLALNLLEFMLQGGVSPANGARNPASGDSSSDKVGVEWWDGRLRPPRPDPVSFGIVIDGCAVERNAAEAIRLLNRMRSEEIGGTLGDFQQSKSGTGRQEKAEVRLRRTEEEEVKSFGIGGEHDGQTTSCENSGRVNRVTAEDSLSKRPQVADGRNRAGDGSVIARKLREIRPGAGENHERHHVRGRMGHIDVQDRGPQRPNAYCVTAAISACGRAGMPDKGVEILLDALDADAEWLTGRHNIEQLARETNVSGTISCVSVDDQVASVATGGWGNQGVGRVRVGGERRTGGGGGGGGGSQQTSAVAEDGGQGVLLSKGGGGRGRMEREKDSLRPAITAAVDACVKAGLFDKARALAVEMDMRGFSPGVELFTSLIAMASDWEEASGILQDMQLAQVAPDTVTFTAAIKACRRGGDLSAALALLERMRSGEGQSGVDEVAYVETAAVCATARDDARAVGLLAKMREDGVKPGPMMYGAVIDACARTGNWQRALDLLEGMEKGEDKVRPWVIHFSSAIFACAVGLQPGKSIELLSRMLRRGLKPNATCVNAAMHGFSLIKDWEGAMELLAAMTHDYGVSPDTISYNTAMAACVNGGNPYQARTLLCKMRSAHPVNGAATAARSGNTPLPDTGSFNIVLKAVGVQLGAAGHVEASALLDDLRARGLKMDAMTIGAAKAAGVQIDSFSKE